MTGLKSIDFTGVKTYNFTIYFLDQKAWLFRLLNSRLELLPSLQEDPL
jgi:hypothetical protein